MSSQCEPLMTDDYMIMNHAIRFWKHKAFRAEQQRDREIKARKALEEELEKYKCIPQELLEKVTYDMKVKRLDELKTQANSLISSMGLLNLTKLFQRASTLENIDDKIKLLRDTISFYKSKVDDEPEEEFDLDE
jgi:hypothetical protein